MTMNLQSHPERDINQILGCLARRTVTELGATDIAKSGETPTKFATMVDVSISFIRTVTGSPWPEARTSRTSLRIGNPTAGSAVSDTDASLRVQAAAVVPQLIEKSED